MSPLLVASRDVKTRATWYEFVYEFWRHEYDVCATCVRYLRDMYANCYELPRQAQFVTFKTICNKTFSVISNKESRLKAQVHYYDPVFSVVRLSIVNFSQFRPPQKLLNRIQRSLTGSKIPTPSTTFVFIRPFGNQDGCPGL